MSNPELKEVKRQIPMPGWLFAIPFIYLAILVSTAIAFRTDSILKILGLEIPASVIWFGTLGGVVASLQGIFAYNKKWNDRYTIWHVLSGLVGGVYGLASYLFLLAIVKTATQTQPFEAPFYALVAFSIGYGQSNFHAMIDQVFSIVFHTTKPSNDQGNNPNS